MFDQRARPYAARLLGPLGDGPIAGLSPVVITGFGLVVGLAAAGVASLGWWLIALTLWWLNRLIDGVDGLVARATGRASDLGGYVDMCADVVVYAALPLGVAVGHDTRSVWIAAAFLVASFYVNIVAWSYLSALLEKRAAGAASTGEATSITMPRGLVEGVETIVMLSVVVAVPRLAAWTMGVMAAAVAFSAVLHVINGVYALAAVDG